jgi:hypothetical protein
MLYTTTEVGQDFDRLVETSMLFHGSDWESQEGRFTDGVIDYTHRVVYWFERYADLVLAKSMIKRMGEDFVVLYDSVMEQWILTSTYATESWR